MLQQLSEYSSKLVELNSMIEEQENVIQSMKAERDLLSNKAIPSLMQEIGVARIQLSSGETIEVDQVYYGKATLEGIQWLKDSGNQDLVKSEVKIPFGRGSLTDDRFNSLISDLSDKGLDFQVEETVHPKTLSSFLKEQVKKGLDVPLETFNAYVKSITKVKK